MKLDIIYEDKDILVCYKPAGIATQTASLSGQDMDSLIRNHLARKQKEKSPYIGILHRLDQPVSGLLVFAKNKKAAAGLSKQIQDGNANKDYLAMCYKVPNEKNGTLIHYMTKNPVTKMAEVIEPEIYLKQAKDKKEEVTQKTLYKKAVLEYEIEKELEDASIVKIHLKTGRFHQIRAQFAAVGNPLLGDMKYGTTESKDMSTGKQITKIALCAYRLVLKHPSTGKDIEFILSEEKLPQWYRI